MSKPSTYRRSRKNGLSRSMTVRLALHNMEFEGVVEWVKAFKELDKELKGAEELSDRLSIINTKFSRLEKLFEHLYPKLSETNLDHEDLIELEAVVGEEPIKRVEEQSTDELLEAIKNNP